MTVLVSQPDAHPFPIVIKGRLPAILYITALSTLLMGFFLPFQATRFAKSDSGVFLYIGQQIVRGFEPYEHAWDHKPPLIFYIDAFGLLIGRGSVWGVWLVAFAACAVALWLCFKTILSAFGHGPALLGVVCMASLLVVTMEYANIVELYALPLQLTIIGLWMGVPNGRKYFSIGVATGLLFLLRPNLVGAGIAVAITAGFLSSGRRLTVLKFFAWMLAGILVPLLISASYFAAKGHLHAVYEATVLFNIEYSAVPWRTKLSSLMPGINAVFGAGIAFLTAGGALFGVLSRFQQQSRQARPLVLFCIVDLAIESILACFSGRGYLHYFMTWAPAAGLLCAYSGYVIIHFSSANPIQVWKSHSVRVGSAILAIAICLVHGTLLRSSVQKFLSQPDDSAREMLVRYISGHTNVSDGIYVWGYGPELYVMTKRFSPSRYFMHTPLAVRKFTDRSMISEIMRDLAMNPPRLLIDSSYAIDGSYPHLDVQGREAWTRDNHGSILPLKPLFEFVDNSYDQVTVTGVGKWIIYARKN